MSPIDRVHDRAVLDALESLDAIEFVGHVWRTTARDRDPLKGSAADGRWSPGGEFEVLYTSLEHDGSLAEIGYRLSLEPVWPSRIEHRIHCLAVRTERTLRFFSVADLVPFGVEPKRYQSFDYKATQAIAAAARFLDYDGLIVPSARNPSSNLVLFMDRGKMGSLEIENSKDVDWHAWRASRSLR